MARLVKELSVLKSQIWSPRIHIVEERTCFSKLSSELYICARPCACSYHTQEISEGITVVSLP